MATFAENIATIASCQLVHQDPPDGVVADSIVQGAQLLERMVDALERIAEAQRRLAGLDLPLGATRGDIAGN